MELLWIIGGLPIGIVLFLLINEFFNIYYLGFKGMSGTFMSCWAVGIVIMALLGSLAKWIILIGVIIWILSKFFKGKPSK